MRRSSSVAALLLVALAGPPLTFRAASAHEGHLDFKWRKPTEGGDVSGKSVRVHARARFEDKVDRWLVEALAPDGDETLPGFGPVCEGMGGGERSVEIVCDWDTTAYPDGSLSWNDTYRLRVTVWNGGEETSSADTEKGESEDDEGRADDAKGEASSTTTTTTTTPAGEAHVGSERLVTVANPPSAPGGVRLDYAEKANQVSLGWDPNPEPDIAGYLVEERFEDGGWSLVAKPTTTSWTGKPAKKGTYRYRVAAVRYVGSSERLVDGPAREPQSGTKEVEADPPRQDRGDDSDSGSRSDATSSTTTTGPKSASADSGRKRSGKDDGKEAAGADGSSTTTSTEPVGSITVTYDGRSPGEPGFPEAIPGPGDAAPVAAPKPVMSSIQPGAPGSVETRYADPAPLAGPVSAEEAYDPGFALTLPYPKEVRLEMAPPPEPPRLLGTVAVFESGEQQQRVLVGVAAAGLLTFIVSMQVVFLTRKPGRLPDLAVTSDWD